MTFQPNRRGLAAAGHNTLAIDYLPIQSVTPDLTNARIHSKKQIRQIARSIEAFGFNVPILIDAGNRVIAGHGRLEALRLLDWNDVPVIRVSHLSAEQLSAFRIADNRLTELSTWDERLLGEQLKLLTSVDLSFDIEAIGFTMGEIDLKIEGLDLAPEDEVELPIPDVSGPAVTVTGDLWHMGCHRVICGDALDAGVIAALMGQDQAALVFSDPPYNVKIEGHVSGLGKHHHREFAFAAGEMDAPAFTGFLTASIRRMVESCKPGSLLYLCMDWRHVSELLAAAAANTLAQLNLCVWTKPNAGMGSFYRSQHELVFVFKTGEAAHRNNVELGRHGRNRTNVWPYAAGPGFGRAGEEGNLAALHPTVKPVGLVADAILDSSCRNDIVLDLFLGSGTTVMAAERVGRRTYGVEIDPLYVDCIIRRWQAYTGGVAIHAASGQAFDEVGIARTGEVAQ